MVVAKHCANRGDEEVYVKSDAESARGGIAEVGNVVWRSPDTDLALVKINPTVHNTRACGTTSHGGPSCIPITSYSVNALGRVLTASLRTRSIYAQPVPGSGDPGEDETFATSGSTTGVQLEWNKLSERAWPTNFRNRRDGDEAASSNTAFLLGGDSGGPVFNASSGKLYGIITDQLPRTTQPSTMVYIKLSKFFKEMPRYSLVTS
ncbi:MULTISPECIES: S1 family peptidase [unclassified Curtobacterium]|uniref:S1 family peptidase n=1 Tax=unclassified Curtobacterium TaxID=257496 RepID=UPI0021ACC673|nr:MULTISPECIES: S1 family peptidase [unclassified Curtobacterium]